MNWLIPTLFCAVASAASAPGDPLDPVRDALNDGQATLAIWRLQQIPKKEATGSSVDLLMARALNASGRHRETIALLEKKNAGAETRLCLAEAYAALGRFADAKAIYAGLTSDPLTERSAALGLARTLAALGQPENGAGVLTRFRTKNPADSGVALSEAGILIDAKRYREALERIGPGRDQLAALLSARARLGLADTAGAAKAIEGIQPSADLASAFALTRADVAMEINDNATAEKVLETFISENPSVPALTEVFARLDAVYAHQGAASGSELRRWMDDTARPDRAVLARLYLARNEARNSKAERARQLFTSFLHENPTHPLAPEAVFGLASSLLADGEVRAALDVLGAGPIEGKLAFLRGQALVATGSLAAAAEDFDQAARDPNLRQAALVNSAICAGAAGVPANENSALIDIASSDADGSLRARIRLTEGLLLAARGDARAASLLSEVAELPVPAATRARLALGEWQFLHGDRATASTTLRGVESGTATERTDYLAVFLADSGEDDSEAAAIEGALKFLRDHPDSRFVPDVRMKLGEIYYRRGDYLGARSQFGAIADEAPGSELATAAQFYSAQSMARSMDVPAMESAIEIYEAVAKAGGVFGPRARLAQAEVFNSLGRPKEAIGVLDDLIKSRADAGITFEAIMTKGDTQFSVGSPASYKDAVTTWKSILNDASAPPAWRNQALARTGAAYEKLGDSGVALDAYFSALARPPGGEPEYFWSSKAGFDAGRLLEQQKLFNEAIAIYEKLAALGGPRAAEASERVNKLRLENFLWEN